MIKIESNPHLMIEKKNKIKLEPSVEVIDPLVSQFVIGKLQYKPEIVQKIKLNPCYPITNALPAGGKTRVKMEFECVLCFRRFERKSSLTRHIRVHKRKNQS